MSVFGATLAKAGLFQELRLRSGRYRGTGIGRDGAELVASLEVAGLAGDAGFELRFRAEGAGGRSSHEERSFIGLCPEERLGLWSFSSNHPRVLRHELRREETRPGARNIFVFGYGEPSDPSVFRQEIALELCDNGDLGYRCAWALPGAELAPCAGARLRREPTDLQPWHVALPVHNLERSLGFYCQGLGLALLGRDECPSKAQAFVEVEPGGFTLELFEPRGESRLEPRRLPDHLAFETHDIEELRSGLMRRGVPGVPAIQTFGNGVRSLALRDPDGVALEIFQGRAIYERSLRAPG